MKDRAAYLAALNAGEEEKEGEEQEQGVEVDAKGKGIDRPVYVKGSHSAS